MLNMMKQDILLSLFQTTRRGVQKVDADPW